MKAAVVGACCPVKARVTTHGAQCSRRPRLCRTMQSPSSAPSQQVVAVAAIRLICKTSSGWSLLIGLNGKDHGIIVEGERCSKLLDGSSKFVLTYEDKDGDWMFVGDVPWGTILTSEDNEDLEEIKGYNPISITHDGSNRLVYSFNNHQLQAISALGKHTALVHHPFG